MPKDLDLLISVLPEESSKTPKLFVSNNNQFPQKRNDADYSSVSTSGNIIFIKNEDLKEASKSLYLGLVWTDGDQGPARILVEWAKEIQAIPNGEKIIENSNSLHEVSSAVVRLKIPKEDDIDRIVIHVDALSPSVEKIILKEKMTGWGAKKESLFLEVFIDEGASVPFMSKIDSISRGSLWFEWDTIIISKDSEIFCADCMYTLNLRFSQNAFVSFQAQTFKKTTKIDGTTKLDGVQKDMLNSYSFKIREAYKEEDFVLSVGVQQGKVRVYVDCDTQPESSSSYAWNYLVESSEEILLTKQQRSKCLTENYFFIVYGEESSIYSLRAMPQKSNHLSFGKDTPISGEILPQEKITYEMFFPFFATEEFTVDLRSKQSLDLSVINCRFSTDCPGLAPTDRQRQIARYYDFNYQYVDKFTYQAEKVNDGLHVKINPRESGCYPLIHQDRSLSNEPSLVCAYLVTLVNQQFYPVEYSLETKYKGLNLLGMGKSVFGSVTKDNGVFYVLDLSNVNIGSVQIQFTKISGDFDIFISTWDQYPKEDTQTHISIFHEGLAIFENLFGGSVLYYIGVYGLETSSFSVSAVSRLCPGSDYWTSHLVMNEDSAWTLTPGKPQKGVLLPRNERPAQYYKFLLAQDNDWEGTLRITVNSLRGRILLVVNNNVTFPAGRDYMWRTEDDMWRTKGQELEISSNDPNFKKKGFYYVGILVDQTDPEASSLADIVYHISYNLLPNPTPTFLLLNNLFYGVLKRNEINYFEFALLVDKFPLTIFQQSNSGKIDLYLSIGSQNKYPSKESFTKTTKNQHKDYITITSEDFQKFCDSEICSAYITLIPTEDHQEIDYSLLVRSDSSFQPIALQEGHQIQSITPFDGQSALFYLHAIPFKNSVITVNCSERDVVIYARRINGEIRSFDMKSLDEKTAEVTSIDHSGRVAHISVPPLADSDKTIIAVSVHFGDSKTQNEKELTLFTILASSQIIPLSTGAPYKGDVLKDRYIYFTVEVMRRDCALLISLTNLEGDADLVISYGEDARPTLSDHQFSLITLKKTEVIEIDEDDLSVNSMTGDWVIGIYGRTTASFTLTVVYEEKKIVDLQPEIPVKMSLEESSWTYFTFLHEAERNLQINLTSLSGLVNVYVSSINLDQDLVMNLPDHNHHKWQISHISQSFFSINRLDPQACFSCIYLINVEAVDDSEFILTVQLDKFIGLKDGSISNGPLKPQESVFFVIQTATNTPEVQLTVGIEGSGLDVLASHNPVINQTTYIWKETLTSKNAHKIISLKKPAHNLKAIWDGQNQVNSDRDLFYVLLYNPTKQDSNYTLNTTIKSSKIIIPSRVEQTYDLQPYEKNSFVFHFSPDSDFDPAYEIFADITFYAYHQKGDNVQEFLEGNLRQGQILQAQYWDKESTAGLGQEISFQTKSAPKVRSNTSHAIIEQRFWTKSQIGKYMIDVVNPMGDSVRFRLFFANSRVGGSLNQQPEGIMGEGSFRTYETTLYPGKWYLWVYSCGTAVDLKIEDGDLETGMVTIPKGESYLYQEDIEMSQDSSKMGNMQRSVLVSSNQNHLNKQSKHVIYSSIINDQGFWNYKIEKNDFEIDTSYEYRRDKSQVTVKFQSVDFQCLGPYDKNVVDYEIRLCNKEFQQSEEPYICRDKDECLYSVLTSQPVCEKKLITVDFADIKDGKYFVTIEVTVKHNRNLFMGYFQPYAVGFVNVINPTFVRFLKIVGVIALILLILLCRKGYLKLKTYRENKGIELQNIADRVSYNPLDYDEENQANSEDPQKDTANRVDYLQLDDDGDNQADTENPAKSGQIKQIESN